MALKDIFGSGNSQNNVSSVEDEDTAEGFFPQENQDQEGSDSYIKVDQEGETATEPHANVLESDSEETLPIKASEGSLPDEGKSDNPADDPADDPIDKALEQIVEALNNLEQLFTAKIDRSEYELETLKKQSEEIQEYKADLYVSMLTPVLKPLARTHAHMKRAILKAQANEADTIPLVEVEFTLDDLSELIEDAGVEIRTFDEGDPFEVNAMKITGQTQVMEPEKNKTVNSVSSDAYIFKNTVLEKARTIVNVYSEDQAPSSEQDA